MSQHFFSSPCLFSLELFLLFCPLPTLDRHSGLGLHPQLQHLGCQLPLLHLLRLLYLAVLPHLLHLEYLLLLVPPLHPL